MNNSYLGLVQRFHSLERDNSLFEITIKEHPFWEYMRYHLFEEINRSKSQVQIPIKKRSYLQKINELVRYFIYRLACLIQRQKKFDLLLMTHTRTAEIDGKKVYFHTYPLAMALSKSFKVMIAHRHEFPISKSDYPCPVLITRPLFLFSRLKAYCVRFSAEEQAVFARLGSLINNAFGIDLDIHGLARRFYAFQLACYREFSRFFKYYKPSVIIYCDSGEMKPILKAAHEEGIEAIDYQHGIISDTNILYRYPNKSHWEKLKATNADYVFTFGDYWNDFLNTPSRPVSAGFPYFDLCRKQPESSEKREKGILITSVLSSRKELAQLAVELADLLPNHNIFYRRRPEEHDFENAYLDQFSGRPNIKVVGGPEGTLYDDFSKCRYLITTNSMTLYEGMASGLTTFILKAGWHDEVRDLYQKNYAWLVSSAQEIAKLIEDQERPPSSIPTEHLFKTNSIDHVTSFLSPLLRQKGTVVS